MDSASAGMGGEQESMLEVRVELVDLVPKIWRSLEVRGSVTLDQVHQVLQIAFGWEDIHLHRFTAADPFAPLRPVDGAIPETLQLLPRQDCEEPDDRPEEDLSLGQLLAWAAAQLFTNTISATAG